MFAIRMIRSITAIITLGTLLLGWLWSAPQARALTVVPMSISQLAAQADLVVFGTVRSKTCLRDDRGRIHTRVELVVAEAWKGTPSGSVITVVHGGGVLGEERVVIPGQVEYEIGAEVVGFFVINGRGEAVTLSLSQGKFEVWRDAVTGERHARNPFHGADKPSERAGKASDATAPAPLPLLALKQVVVETRK